MTDPFLVAALEGLAAAELRPEWFEQVSRWRRSCGDAEAAARWQLWSLMPPEPAELEPALAEIWLGLGDVERAERLLPAQQPSWDRLALLLEQGQLEPAQALQAQLLAAPPELSPSQLLQLAGTWQRAERPGEALELLDQLLAFYSSRQLVIAPALANALAQLLEQQQRFADAAHWWRYSLLHEPNQLPPLMRLARQALREQQPLVAVHYARQVLERDPQHPWAPRLLRQALAAQGARGSLALLAGEPLPSPWLRRQHQWLAPLAEVLSSQRASDRSQTWIARGPVRPLPLELATESSGAAFELALWGDGDGLALTPLLLELSGRAGTALVVWLLASPEPLLQQHNLELLLPAQAPVQLRWWPSWDSKLHGRVRALVLARSRQAEPASGAIGAGCTRWRWNRPNRQWYSDAAINNSPSESMHES